MSLSADKLERSVSPSSEYHGPDNDQSQQVQQRRAVFADELVVLSDIYQDDVNLACWQRQLASALKLQVKAFTAVKPNFKLSLTVSPERAESALLEQLGVGFEILAAEIAELVDMFCYLFDLPRTGLRLSTLNAAMCPKFHVDRVPCRLVTTLQGDATEWLPHAAVDRSKLGAGSAGLADHLSGLYQHATDVQQLRCGDVALLKGENWFNNAQAGLVHRSPQVTSQQSRLFLSLDFAD
ncbi:MAG: DUF1826 domain-containing protein [Pseudomonadales bacterium]|nr:DUF1826 domain-containing protein [Pseudomonadales bacterium]